MNVVMTGTGKFVELQGTGEESPFTVEQLNSMLDLAFHGIAELISLQKRTLGEIPLYDPTVIIANGQLSSPTGSKQEIGQSKPPQGSKHE